MRLQNTSQVLFSVCVLRVDVPVNVQLSVFQHDRLVTQLDRNRLVQLYRLSRSLSSRCDAIVCSERSVFEARLRSIAKVFHLIIRQTNATMRSKLSDLRGDLPP